MTEADIVFWIVSLKPQMRKTFRKRVNLEGIFLLLFDSVLSFIHWLVLSFEIALDCNYNYFELHFTWCLFPLFLWLLISCETKILHLLTLISFSFCNLRFSFLKKILCSATQNCVRTATLLMVVPTDVSNLIQ